MWTERDFDCGCNKAPQTNVKSRLDSTEVDSMLTDQEIRDVDQNLRDGKLLSNRLFLHENKGFDPVLQMMYANSNTLLDERKTAQMMKRLQTILSVPGTEIEQHMYLEEVMLPEVTIQWLRQTFSLWRHEAEALLIKQEDAQSGQQQQASSSPTGQLDIEKKDKVDIRLAHILLAAQWCRRNVFRGKVTEPEILQMDSEEQRRAMEDLKNDEENVSSTHQLFIFNFEYQSDFEMFCGEFVDKGYRVDASFEEGD